MANSLKLPVGIENFEEIESLGFYKRKSGNDSAMLSRNDGKKLEAFCNAFLEKDPEKIEQIFGDYLWNTISIRDMAAAKALEQIEKKRLCG